MAFVLMLAGCGPTLPLQGPIEITPDGYPVSLPAFQDPAITKALVLGWVDLRVAQWISEKATWGLEDYSDTELKRYAASVPIIVVDDSVIHGDATGFNRFGYYIEVTLYARPWSPALALEITPPNSVESFGRGCWIYGGVGVLSLPHELTHTVLGDFHP